jgi:hypothetical protein
MDDGWDVKPKKRANDGCPVEREEGWDLALFTLLIVASQSFL